MEQIISFIQSIIVMILMIFGRGETPPESQIPPPPSFIESEFTQGSQLEIHFLDVGQADAALVLCDGEAMLIDGGNRGDSSLLYSYLERRGVTELDYVVGTHAHEDHIGGIPGALHYADAGVTYCPERNYDSKTFRDFRTAVEQCGSHIQVPQAGDSFRLGSAVVQVLYCDPGAQETNNTSIVLRIVHGDTSFLFMGDAEREVEQAILELGYELESDVLKTGHHGSDTSTGYQFLYEVDPDYAIISVGEGNTYGHPEDAVLSRLRDAEVTTYRTDRNGTIVCTGDGETLQFYTER